MKKLISCMVILAIAFSTFSVCALAEDSHAVTPPIERRASELIKSYSCSLTRSGRNLSSNCVIMAMDIMDQIGVSSFSIQEKRDGEWVSVKSVEGSYFYNRTGYTGNLTYTGRPGYEYRAVANFYVKDGSLSDTASKTSSIREIPNT